MVDHIQETYGIRPEAEKFPMMCVISFVYVCNAKCPNCPYTNSEIRNNFKDRQFMGEETFKIIADQCGEHGTWIRISGGGEPMLHPQAVELIEYAKKKGAKVGLITNGSLFNEHNSEQLLKAQVDMIEFSVDACDRKIYSEVRNGLSWDILLANVKRMVALRDQFNSTTRIIASAIDQKGVEINKIAEFWEPIVDNFQKRKFLSWGIVNCENSGDPTPYLSPAERIPCPFLFERLNIDSRGKVMVCGFDIASVTDMGSVHEKSIREIWLGEGFEFYREKHLSRNGCNLELCQNCPDWKYRSWKHNYWKVLQKAEAARKSRNTIK